MEVEQEGDDVGGLAVQVPPHARQGFLGEGRQGGLAGDPAWPWPCPVKVEAGLASCSPDPGPSVEELAYLSIVGMDVVHGVQGH